MDEITLVTQSYERCMQSPTFFSDFYSHFMSKGRLIQEKFKNTDMTHQMNALKHGLQYMIMFASGSKIAATKIDDLATTHDRNHRAISPDMYEDWMASLLQTVKEHDKEYSKELAWAWKNVMSHGIVRMKTRF